MGGLCDGVVAQPVREADEGQGFLEPARDVLALLRPLGGDGIRQRPVIWRAFAVNAEGGPVVLPGGLARVGKTGDPLMVGS